MTRRQSPLPSAEAPMRILFRPRRLYFIKNGPRTHADSRIIRSASPDQSATSHHDQKKSVGHFSVASRLYSWKTSVSESLNSGRRGDDKLSDFPQIPAVTYPSSLQRSTSTVAASGSTIQYSGTPYRA